ncbi:hypothetical protein MKK84_27895 [Methylobacterium sp. E-065]|uniref:hypothetical protein n=1 Tax=Methylobacterium sp. E-065 TaxID=2836583 RepID=UPI001FBB0F09|nr:hypothetical protein [Methylobacterium sp. E-065]MCJ2021194.1 hypothetical protein [Methylobacterium sp. E-065]
MKPPAFNAAMRSRIDRLEAAVGSPPEPTSRSPLVTLLTVLTAYHLGDAGPGRSLADGMAAALGYPGGLVFRAAMMAPSGSPERADLNCRWSAATRRLLALKGVSPDCDGPAFAAAVEALYLDLPKYFQQHQMLLACGIVEAAA